MKINLLSLILLCLVFSFSITKACSQTSLSQTITAMLAPYVAVSNIDSATNTVSINNDGTLSSNLTPSFKFVSNNKNGASATFSIKVNTSDSNQVDAIAGINNTSSGKIVLANSNILPTSNAVKDALSDNPTPSNNPNVIAYQVTFKSENLSNGASPVFNKSGNSVSGNVLTKNGTNTIGITINKNSVKSGTFSIYDNVGSYQAIIFSTSAAL